MMRVLLSIMVIVVCCSVLSGLAPASLQAGENLSPGDMAEIFEEVGREKNIPPEILKAIGWVESTWRQFDSQGNARMGAGIYAGIMQVDTQSVDEETLDRLKNDIRFNIEYGADILNRKWDMVPKIGDGDRTVMENWYFALWAYNGLLVRNNPNSRPGETYQDKVITLMASPKYPAEAVFMTSCTDVPAGESGPRQGATYLTPAPVHCSFELTGEKIPVTAARNEPALPVLFPVQPEAPKDGIRAALNLWTASAETVFILFSARCPDSMVGVALDDGNRTLLISRTEELDKRVMAELARLGPTRVVLAGVWPDAVYEQIRGVPGIEKAKIVRE